MRQVVLVIILSVFITHILHDHLLCSLVSCFTTVLCILGPASSLCTTTINARGILVNSVLPTNCCLYFKGIIMINITKSYSIDLLLMLHNKAFIGLLNSIVVSLGSPCLIGVYLICNIAKYASLTASKHFFMVHFMSLIQTSTCPLL